MSHRLADARVTRRTTTRLTTAALAGVTTLGLSACGAVHSVAGIHPPPAAVTTAPAVSTEQGKGVLSRAFTAARQAIGTDATAGPARAVAYTGEALVAATARTRLAAVQPGLGSGSPAISPEQPGLLAISRGPGFPRVIVAQTVPGEGSLPVLHLLTSPDVATPYRIRSSATMFPDSSVKRFDPLRDGSLVTTDGKGLAVAPQALMTAYAQGLGSTSKPAADAPYGSDSFMTQVRDNATRQAKAVAAQAAFTQTHKVLPDATVAVRQAGGDALVFGVIERTDVFSVKKGQTIGAPKEFVALVPGRTRITSRATMTTLEFVIFSVPQGPGKATLVAADDQLVSGSGT